MKFANWDFEKDIITTDVPPLIASEIDTAQHHMGSAYAVDTAQGIFFQEPTEDGKFDLVSIDTTGSHICMDNIVVVASNMKYSAMIVHVVASGENYLVDSRGVFFLLDTEKDSNWGPAQFRFRLDRKTGFYNVEDHGNVRWLIRGIDKMKMFSYMMASGANYEATINKAFLSYIRKPHDIQCLYLTCPKTKKGKMIQAVLNEGIEYDVVPNVLDGDTTLNVCIPRSENNLQQRGFHFLDSRYESTFAIQEVPIESIISVLDLDYKTREKIKIKYSKPSEKQFKAGSSVVNTLKNLLSLSDDVDVYKKFLKKVVDMLHKGEPVDYSNCFDALRISYPTNPVYGDSTTIRQQNLLSLTSKTDYITTRLHVPEVSSAAELDDEALFQLCVRIHKLSGEYRKQVLAAYEAKVEEKAQLGV